MLGYYGIPESIFMVFAYCDLGKGGVHLININYEKSLTIRVRIKIETDKKVEKDRVIKNIESR
jgi:hypothetical protein